MAQTPQQRRANEQFARSEAAKRGKPQSYQVKKKEKPAKAPVSRWALYMLVFVVCGGIVFELIQIVFGAFR